MDTVKFRRYDDKVVHINPDMVCMVMELQSGFTKVTLACGEFITTDGVSTVLTKLRIGEEYEHELL